MWAQRAGLRCCALSLRRLPRPLQPRRALCASAPAPRLSSDFGSGAPDVPVSSVHASVPERLNAPGAGPGELVVVGISTQDVASGRAAEVLDAASGGAFTELVEAGLFAGSADTSVTTRIGVGRPQLCVVGLGEVWPDEPPASDGDGATGSQRLTVWRALGAAAAAAAKGARATSITIGLVEGAAAEVAGEGAGAAVASGALLGLYKDGRLKAEPPPRPADGVAGAPPPPPPPPLEGVTLLLGGGREAEIQRAVGVVSVSAGRGDRVVCWCAGVRGAATTHRVRALGVGVIMMCGHVCRAFARRDACEQTAPPLTQ
jgi:hypothetical protein